MINKRIAALALSVLMLTACSATAKPGSEAPADNTSVAQQAENLSNSSDDSIPSINESFADESAVAVKRGNALIKSTDDQAASDGRALWISNRTDAWNGTDFPADVFRGNDITVKGSFRSTSPSVRVSIQYDINGNTNYNGVLTVKTNDSSYSDGQADYTIPENASNILIYIESDSLDDIYCDSISVNVKGDYKYFAEAAATAFKDTSSYPSLKDEYSEYFNMGVASSAKILEKKEYASLIKQQFNSFTCENAMKPDSVLDHNKCISDTETYMYAPAISFNAAKAELDFARDNGFTVRGHTLVWHNQTPQWLFYKDYKVGGELADRELMLARLENYIKSVMEWTNENYPGLISAWDVVNEAADDAGGIRESLWYQTIGEDYIEQAFAFARKYAPEGTKLFYNDYNAWQGKKQGDIISFLRPVAEAGNIDGVGMQSHLNTQISVPLYIAALKKYNTELGVEIQVTELDIGKTGGDGWERVQGEYYNKLMSELIKQRKNGVPITSVTLWGISDSVSWRATEFPLVFNDDLSRKPAFDGMIEAVENAKQN